MIFDNRSILNTEALLFLGAVSGSPMPKNYDEHRSSLIARVAQLIEYGEGSFANVCATIEQYLGSEGLIECSTMKPFEMAESILMTSPGAGLLADLRERWHQYQVNDLERGQPRVSNLLNDVTLEQWLEQLVAEYTDIID